MRSRAWRALRARSSASRTWRYMRWPDWATSSESSDDLVGTQQEIGRKHQVERAQVLAIDDQLEVRRPLHGELARLCALQHLVDESGGAVEELLRVHAVRHQAARVHELARGVDRRQAMPRRELDHVLALRRV